MDGHLCLGGYALRAVVGLAPIEAPGRQMDDTLVPATEVAKGEYRRSFLAAIDRALILKIDGRPQDADQFRNELLSSDAEPGVPGTDTTSDNSVMAEAKAKSEATGASHLATEAALPPATTAAPRTRNSTFRWVAVVAVIVALGAGGYLGYQHLEAERQRVQRLADERKEQIARMRLEAEEGRRKAEAERKRREEAERRRIEEERRRRAELERKRAEEERRRKAGARILTTRSPFQGAKVTNLTKALVDRLSLDDDDRGVVVVSVAPGSHAQRSRLQPDDLIMSVSGERIESVEDLARAASSPAARWRIQLKRRGRLYDLLLGGR